MSNSTDQMKELLEAAASTDTNDNPTFYKHYSLNKNESRKRTTEKVIIVIIFLI